MAPACRWHLTFITSRQRHEVPTSKWPHGWLIFLYLRKRRIRHVAPPRKGSEIGEGLLARTRARWLPQAQCDRALCRIAEGLRCIGARHKKLTINFTNVIQLAF